MSAADPITLVDFPKAIVHFDGDAFFAACEQALHPAYRGKPLITGRERGIIAAASYEAKALGIKRGLPLHEAKRICPALIMLPSDYETYSLMSKRIYDIMRRYTPMVEESSIDEGFADLTGLRRLHHCSYDEIARKMQATVAQELQLTVSMGLSLSKGLAKLASKFRKPNGFTAVAGQHIHLFLQRHELDDIWGFGRNTTALLQKQGLRTAYDYVLKSESWAEKMLGKIGREIWHELRGESVYPVTTEEKTSYATISKCKTFTAPSSDRDFVWAKLVRNLESAFIKLRRFNLKAKWILVGLRKQTFEHFGMEAEMNRATCATHEALPLLRLIFERLYEAGTAYRATMVTLGKITAEGSVQLELFEDQLRIDKMRTTSTVMDEVASRYGKHKLSLGTVLYLDHHRMTDRDILPNRKGFLLEGETARKRIGLPLLNLGSLQSADVRKL